METNFLDTVLESGIVIATIVIPWVQALVNMLKPFVQDSRLYPLISLAIGIILMVLFSVLFKLPLATHILAGFLAGLSASGFYDLQGGGK